MKVNVAVNGLHLYQNYIGRFARSGLLQRFYYAHRLSTTGSKLGLAPGQGRNLWLKEYLLNAHLRWLPPKDSSLWHTRYGDIWQSGVLRRWQSADTWVAVIGELADRIAARAKGEGSRFVGHAVTSHPEVYAALVNEERERLGLTDLVAPFRVGSRRLEEIALADHILVMSGFAKRGFVASGFPAERVSILNSGVDLRRFHPRQPGEDAPPFRVVCVAQVSLRKGHTYLLEAWKRLRLPGAELLLVGGLSREGRRILAPYDGLFQYVPNIPNDRLRDTLARSALFVLPTIEDAFAQVVAEALACGLPVVTTANAGAADLIRDGLNGYVVPIRDSAALADRIERIYADEGLRQAMAGEAVRMAAVAAGWDDYAARLADILRGLDGGG